MDLISSFIKSSKSCLFVRQLDKFRTRLTSQLAPVGELELLMTERIIAAAWQLRRLIRVETEMMTEDLNQKTPLWQLHHVFADNDDKQHTLGAVFARKHAKIDTYDKLRRYEAYTEASLFRALHELQKIQLARKQNTLPFPTPIRLNLNLNTNNAL